MNWVKSNWLIVVLSVVALAAAPAMYFFSSKLGKDLRDKVQKEAAAAANDVSNSKVTYSVPDVKAPDKKIFEKSADVNEILTKKIAEVREAIKSDGSLLGAEAVKFNQGDHRPLVSGLFPDPGAGGISQKYQFARDFIENLPKQLLQDVNAQGPVDPARLSAELSEYKKAREERMRAVGGAAQSDPADTAKLNEELLAQRLDRYRAWANQTSFYGDIAIFNDIPTAVPNPIPPMTKLWDWQLKSWIYADLFKACALANKLAAGGGAEQGSVLTGVVKRIVKVSVQNQDYGDIPDDTPPEQLLEPQLGEGKNPVTPDMTVSVTGRYSGPSTGNRYYDMREVTVEMIVAPEKLPYLFDALARTNYMTVLKCELDTVDVVDDLSKGYYYGNDHVVRAMMTIETVWIRDWTKQYMPKTVRVSLGIQDTPPAGVDGLPPQ